MVVLARQAKKPNLDTQCERGEWLRKVEPG